MKRSFLYILAISLFTFSATAIEIFAQNGAYNAINKHISQAVKSEEATEYEAARKTLYGDLNGDGKKDAVVQYTLEGFGGGNNWGQRLAVFINRNGVYKFVGEEIIGGKFFTYTSDLLNVRNRKIVLDIETCPEPPQGMCKNPKKGKIYYGVKNGKLKKL